MTDHHRPGAGAARLPDRAPRPRATTPAPSSAPRAWRSSSRRGCAPAPGATPREADEDLDLAALATVCDVVPLRDENRRIVREGVARVSRTRKPGPAGADGGGVGGPGGRGRAGARLPARPAHQRRRAHAAGGRRARAAAHRGRGARRRGGRRARPAQPRPPRGGDADPVRRRGRLRAAGGRRRDRGRRRGLAPGRGGHRGVAPRGALAPAVRGHRARRRRRPRLGPQHLRVRPPRRARRVRRAPDPLRRPPRWPPGVELQRGLGRAVPARARRARRGGAEPRRTCAAASTWTRSCPAGRSRSTWPRSSSACGRSARGNPQPSLLVPGARVENVAAMGDERQHARFTLVTAGGSRSRGVAFGSAPGVARSRPRALPTTSCSGSSATAGKGWRSRGSCCARSATRRPARSGRSARTRSFWQQGRRLLDAPGQSLRGRGPRVTIVDRRGDGFAGVVGELITSGEPVLVGVADVARRRESLETLVAGLDGRRPGGGVLGRARRRPGPGRGLRAPGGARPAARRRGAIPLLGARRTRAPRLGRGRRGLRPRGVAPRAPAAPRAGRDASGRCASSDAVGGRPRRSSGRCAAQGRHPRTAELCARLLACSRELGLIELTLDPPACRVVEGTRTDLELSPTYPRLPASATRRSRRGSGGERQAPARPGRRGVAEPRPDAPDTGSRIESMASTPAKKRAPQALQALRERTLKGARVRAPSRRRARRAGRRPARATKLDRGPARLLGDLFAVLEEHADEAAEQVDRDLVQKAFVFACERHADQRRASGEDFIVHPVGVAKICAGMRLDTATLCAALLHDTVEDTSASLDEVADRLRRRGRGARGRRDQALRRHLPEPRRPPGRELPQDDGRHGPGHPGHPDQARRPAAQHAHARLDAEAEAAGEGQGDARDLRAAGAPARHPRHQVGARGPLVRDAPPAQVQRDQAAGQPAAHRARGLRVTRRPVPREGAARRWASPRRSPGAPSTSTPSTRR